MPKLHVVVPHSVPLDQVIIKARHAIEKSVGDFQGNDLKVTEVNDTTTDFSFRSLGFSIKGRIEAKPAEIVADIDLPLAAIAFKDMAENAVRSNIYKALKAEPEIEDEEE